MSSRSYLHRLLPWVNSLEQSSVRISHNITKYIDGNISRRCPGFSSSIACWILLRSGPKLVDKIVSCQSHAHRDSGHIDDKSGALGTRMMCPGTFLLIPFWKVQLNHIVKSQDTSVAYKNLTIVLTLLSIYKRNASSFPFSTIIRLKSPFLIV